MMNTLPSFAVMGDWGFDHIIVPFSHNPKSYDDYRKWSGKPEHIFNVTPSEAASSEKIVEAGSLLTLSLFKKFISRNDEPSKIGRVEFFPKSDGQELTTEMLYNCAFWHTYSEWLLCMGDKEDDNGQSSHPLWRRQYRWKVNDTFHLKRFECSMDTIAGLDQYDKLVIRDVFLENEKEGLLKSMSEALAKAFKSNKKPLVFLRSIVKKPSEANEQKLAFCQPPLFEHVFSTKLDEQFKEILLGRTILLLGIEELKANGAALQDALSWDSLFEETAQTVRKIPNFWSYYAIVVSFYGLGALLYIPGDKNGATVAEGEFTLVYYPKDIENLTSFSSEAGIFGVTTILHAALAFLCETPTGVDQVQGLRDKQGSLEEAIAAGLYASRKLSATGSLKAMCRYDTEDQRYHIDDLEYAVDTACASIAEYQKKNEERKEGFKASEKRKLPSKMIGTKLPYIFRVKEGAFVSDEEDKASEPKGFSKQRRFKNDQPYPFESILKESLYRAHEHRGDLDKHFKVEKQPSEREKWQHHEQKLTLIDSGIVSDNSVLYQMCTNIVRYGKSRYRIIEFKGIAKVEEAFPSETPLAIPYLRIGGGLAYDSTEIKQICDTNKLLRKYRNDLSGSKPTSICVFGQPGSGKSFLVKQLIDRMKESGNTSLEPTLLTFNISQMNSSNKLIDAWHRVRDLVLQGKLPFVFFDEFDCAYGTQRLGWLKYFISPMEDGTFIGARGHLHEIGKAVFIFGGGLFESMADFKGGRLAGDKKPIENSELRTCKQPDFVGRIRGFINVAGPNKRRDGGMLHYLRRATLLRTKLEKKFGMGEGEFIEVDEDVLRAFIMSEEYHNNTRSMISIIDLSSCPSSGELAVSDIYVDDTLDLYVTSDFATYLRGENLPPQKPPTTGRISVPPDSHPKASELEIAGLLAARGYDIDFQLRDPRHPELLGMLIEGEFFKTTRLPEILPERLSDAVLDCIIDAASQSQNIIIDLHTIEPAVRDSCYKVIEHVFCSRNDIKRIWVIAGTEWDDLEEWPEKYERQHKGENTINA
jgi:hypothetical protein